MRRANTLRLESVLCVLKIKENIIYNDDNSQKVAIFLQRIV